MVSPCYRAPPGGLGLFRCGRVLCNARPPQFQYVSVVAGCLTSLDGHHSHLWRLDAAQSLGGRLLYPRPRVLYLPSATDDEAVRL